MRTTLTVDDDLLASLRKRAADEGVPLKALVNRVLRLGLARLASPSPRRRYRCPSVSLGECSVPTLDKALGIAAELEDMETARKLGPRK